MEGWMWATIVVSIGAFAWWLFFAGRHRFVFQRAESLGSEQRNGVCRETVELRAVDGTTIEAWLLISSMPRPPVVLMAPGLTGTKEGLLERFAARFVDAGLAVLMIDFRTFGGSGGQPRHWVDPLRQIEDYQSAIAFLRADDRVDGTRLVLWGSSFSGSAAVCAAARDAEIAAVIAQVPYLGALPVYRPSGVQIAGYVALSIGETVGDAIAGLFGIALPPVYITTYGKPGERTFAMSIDNPPRSASTCELHAFWKSMPASLRGGWENRMLVRGLRNLDKVLATDELANVRCPVLLIGATRDDMIALDEIRTAADRLAVAGSRYLQLDGGHYDPYVMPLFEANIGAQIEFVREVVAPKLDAGFRFAARSHRI